MATSATPAAPTGKRASMMNGPCRTTVDRCGGVLPATPAGNGAPVSDPDETNDQISLIPDQ